MFEGICTSPELLWCSLWGGSVNYVGGFTAIEKYYLDQYKV